MINRLKKNYSLLLTFIVPLTYSLSFVFYFNRIIGLILLAISILLFGILILKRKFVNSFWVIILLALVQNISFSVFSAITASFFSEEYLIDTLKNNQFYSYVFLEGKLLLSSIWVFYIIITDILSALKGKFPFSRSLLYLLFLILGVFVLYNGTTFNVGFVGNLRSYLSIFCMLVIGLFLGSKCSNNLEIYFPKRLTYILVFILSGVNIFTDIVLRYSLVLWNELLGIRYLYYSKQLFSYLEPVTRTNGRFATDILGFRLQRSGGIMLEPVNYGYALALIFTLCVFYYFKTKSRLSLFALLLSTVFLILNLGKASILFVSIVLFTYLFIKIFYSQSSKAFFLWIILVLLIILSVIEFAPIISTSTEGHLNSFNRLISHAAAVPTSILLGNGIGTAGNFGTDAAFVESAFVVIIYEIGVLWFLLLAALCLFLARQIHSRKDIHPLLISFGMVSIINIFIAGTFQENVFSLQTGLFTITIGAILASSQYNHET